MLHILSQYSDCCLILAVLGNGGQLDKDSWTKHLVIKAGGKAPMSLCIIWKER